MKKRIRKLRLNRETLRNLDSAALGHVAGGATETNCTLCCPSGPQQCGPETGYGGECLTSSGCDGVGPCTVGLCISGVSCSCPGP